MLFRKKKLPLRSKGLAIGLLSQAGTEATGTDTCRKGGVERSTSKLLVTSIGFIALSSTVIPFLLNCGETEHSCCGMQGGLTACEIYEEHTGISFQVIYLTKRV